jgi:hypothetical protein
LSSTAFVPFCSLTNSEREFLLFLQHLVVPVFRSEPFLGMGSGISLLYFAIPWQHDVKHILYPYLYIFLVRCLFKSFAHFRGMDYPVFMGLKYSLYILDSAPSSDMCFANSQPKACLYSLSTVFHRAKVLILIKSNLPFFFFCELCYWIYKLIAKSKITWIFSCSFLL